MATSTADVAKAKLALAQAKVNLENATLVAPISGTVASMPFVTGHAMTISDAISIVGSGSVRLTIDVAETSIGQVKTGQAAAVSVSAGPSSAGKVTTIGILPSASSTSSTVTYPVTVTVPKPGAPLAAGVTASASVTVASAEDVVVLPVSAVTRTSETSGTVTTLDADYQATSIRVELGAAGRSTVQISSGLAAGQRVALADRTAALPASNTTATRRAGSALGGPAGGFGGGTGLPPGGGVPRTR